MIVGCLSECVTLVSGVCEIKCLAFQHSILRMDMLDTTVSAGWGGLNQTGCLIVECTW